MRGWQWTYRPNIVILSSVDMVQNNQGFIQYIAQDTLYNATLQRFVLVLYPHIPCDCCLSLIFSPIYCAVKAMPPVTHIYSAS